MAGRAAAESKVQSPASRVGRSSIRALLAGIIAAACTPGAAAPPAGAPVADPAGTAAALAAATAPAEARQIHFNWTLDEAGSRVRGRGVVRLSPPDRLRLDLFGPRNETVLAAALVGGEARLPAGAQPGVALPSPALLWAGLGVVRPPAGATLESATEGEGVSTLRYRSAAGELYEYQVAAAQPPRLQQLQRSGEHGPLETVSLERDGAGGIARARYRDWAAFRDLTLEIDSIAPAASFPDAIWTP